MQGWDTNMPRKPFKHDKDRRFSSIVDALTGHARQLCALAGRLVSERRNLIVTIFLGPNLLDKARFEISRQLPAAHEDLQRIRIVSLFQAADLDMAELFPLFIQSYPAAYNNLLQRKPITCATTGTTFDSAPAPSAIIMDFCAPHQLQATRSLSGSSVPVLAWVSGAASAMIRLHGPESLGGLGDLGAKIDAEAARTGRAPDDIGDEEFHKYTDGTVLNIPGLPPMYDYEYFPQNLPFKEPLSPYIRGGYPFLMECDGAIITTAHAYETMALDAFASWFSDLLKPFYAVGPLLPPDYGSDESSRLSQGDAEVKTFLDNMLSQHGEQSVIFISFGTTFWPTIQEYVDEVIEALIEKKVPFILCYASPFAKISAELPDRVKSSGIGMITKWSPQQFILNHPATGWFLTHCGHGSVTESISSGTPLICWPFCTDQPSAARHLSQTLNVAFELIEVRTGLGLKPIYGSGRVPRGTREAVGIEIRGIIDECRGDVGKEKRRNVMQLKVEFAKAWEADGPARKALQDFLAKYV